MKIAATNVFLLSQYTQNTRIFLSLTHIKFMARLYPRLSPKGLVSGGPDGWRGAAEGDRRQGLLPQVQFALCPV